MKVLDLLSWLQTQPISAEVYIHDADTGWALPLKTGPDKYNYGGEERPNCIFVHGDYNERLKNA